jgi:pyruvate,water dikinase
MSAALAPVVWFDELEGDARSVAGGKCASLVEMRRAGFPVPVGFAITIAAFEQFGNETGVSAKVNRIVASADPDSTAALRAASEEIAALVEDVRLPDTLISLIDDGYRRIAEEAGESEPAVAVRSSAAGEDSAEASFAGQQETYLWVRGAPELEHAVRRCWASYFTPRALSYRARLRGTASASEPVGGDLAGGQSPTGVGMSVGVQQMVDADVAGVMFTRSPSKNDPSIVAIEASWGLGVSVVGGEVTPDEVWVNKVTREIVRREPGYKQLRYVPDREAGGTRCEDVPEDEAMQLCLDDETAKALAEYGVQLERHYGAAQDIEWALTKGEDGTTQIVLLQSRPITVSRGKEPIAKPQPSMTDYVINHLISTSKKKIEL